ncbi:hypothetical protein [Streptomyces sp. NPDC088554]|uniref:hypothetical protein n=1 Tax=Streptomyces sp. NPDC088554 TaxID=3365865 RepID=UPI00381342AB
MTVSPQNSALELFDFDQEVYDLVRATAPRLFAVVVEYRGGPEEEDRDAAVVAWGLAHEDGAAEVTRVGGGGQLRLAAPESVARYFGRGEGCVPRVVWLPGDGVDVPAEERAA